MWIFTPFVFSLLVFFVTLFHGFFLCKTVNMHITVSVILCLYSLLKHIIKINKIKKLKKKKRKEHAKTKKQKNKKNSSHN